MAKAQTYIKDIRAQVKAANDGKVPEYLNLTIREVAKAMDLRDFYEEKMRKEGASNWEQGSTGFPQHKQHPLCNLIYQQNAIIQTGLKMLGLTATKAAAKPEGNGGKDASSKMEEYLEATME